MPIKTTRCSRCGCATCKRLQMEDLKVGNSCVSPALQGYLSKTLYTTVCHTCLGHLDDMVEHAAQRRFPVSPEDFELGVHYSIEKGLWVFSELYHIMKGYCCRNGCKHCAYGFTSKQG